MSPAVRHNLLSLLQFTFFGCGCSSFQALVVVTVMLRRCSILRLLPPEVKLELTPIIFTKTILGPTGGFCGEERLVKSALAEKYLDDGVAVPVTPENRAGVWTYNVATAQFDKYVERTSHFLDFQYKKRQWLDVYWRVNTGYLLIGRCAWGQGSILNCPLRKKDVAQKLWEQLKVRVNPQLLEFREQDRRTGIQDLGHNFCWLYLPGAEALNIDREVYDNKRVKVRLHIRKLDADDALY